MSGIGINAADLPELELSNPMLGDRAALDAAWGRDGYWLFRDQLDKDALKQLQEAYLNEITTMGIVDQGAEGPVFNGKSVAETAPHIVNDGFSGLRIGQPEPWLAFVKDPKINDAIGKLINCTPRQLPFGGTRVFPPDTGADLKRDRFNGAHQDAFYNEGYGFTTCWVSVWDAPRAAGGLAIAPGMHRGGLYHDVSKPPHYPLRDGAIPDSAWRTAHFRAGDVLVFHHKMPHTGIRNRSEKNFRVSFDVRFVAAGEAGPIYGTFVSMSGERVTIKENGGMERTFEFAENSFCRGRGADFSLRLPASEISKQYQPGMDILVVLENGKLKMLRAPND
jgi:ectoine hydroxylase-related dioxygenase (phytanoyl-CoA dioxygenase family)